MLLGQQQKLNPTTHIDLKSNTIVNRIPYNA
jgi:hypothetical protein